MAYIETEKLCPDCERFITVYPAKKTPAQCLARTLPAWKKCNCGWQEIATSTLEGLAPNWKLFLDPDEDDETGTLDDALADVEKLVEEFNG